VRNDVARHHPRLLERGRYHEVQLTCPLGSRCFQTLRRRRRDWQGEKNPDPADPLRENHLGARNFPPDQAQRNGPEPPRSLLTRPVVLTISVYAVHAFLEASDSALVPLVYTTQTRFGGLGLDSILMGTCLTTFGIIMGIVPFFFFDRIANSLGRRRALVTFMSGLVPAFLLFPINGTRARHVGMDVVTWVLVLLHLFLMVGINMTYGTSCPPLASVELPEPTRYYVAHCRRYFRIYQISSSRRDDWGHQRARTNRCVRTARHWARSHGLALLLLVGE